MELAAAQLVSTCAFGHASSKSLRATACLPQSLMSEPVTDRKFVFKAALQASFANSDDVAVVLSEVVGDVVTVRDTVVVPLLEMEAVAEELCVLVWVVLGLVLSQPLNSPSWLAFTRLVSSTAMLVQSGGSTRNPSVHAMSPSPLPLLTGPRNSPMTLLSTAAVLALQVNSACPLGSWVQPSAAGAPLDGQSAIARFSWSAWPEHS